jgi:hypothetical protein
MSAFVEFLASLWKWVAARTAKVALWTAVLTLLGPITPILTAIGQFIGGILTAIGEILASLSKSPEGRVAICLLAAGAGFLYLRFHYVEEGRAMGREEGRAKGRAEAIALRKPCPVAPVERRKR